jgi:hypothetical protein
MPQLFTYTLTVLFLALMVVGLWSRRHLGDRAVFLLGIGLTVGILLGTTYAGHKVTHTFPGLQGRYLYVLLVPMLVLIAIGLDRLVRLVRLRSRVLMYLVPAAGLAVTGAGLLMGFQLYYLEPGQSVGRALDIFLGWAPWAWWVVAAMVAAMVACALVLAFSLGRERGPFDVLPEPADDDTPEAGSDRSVPEDDADVTQPQTAVHTGAPAYGAGRGRLPVPS